MRNKIKNNLRLLYHIIKGYPFLRTYIGFKRYDLIVYDDIFPCEKSLFRFVEFSCYLKSFKRVKVLSSGTALEVLGEKKSFTQLKRDYLTFEKDAKLYFFGKFVNFNTKLMYCVFLHNAFRVIEYIDYYKIPFIFTLYPGGCFKLNNVTSDRMLQRVTQSPNLKKIIVTQKVTRNYLLRNNFCTEDKIEYIFGVVGNTKSSINESKKIKWGIDKGTFDICFVGAKYTPLGKDKGYDTFIAVARELSLKHNMLRFHVVGGFNETDINVCDLGRNITFYGFQNTTFLTTFFQRMDLIISPNIPFQLDEGAFDGFPLGTCIEASLNCVSVMACDELEQNDNNYNEDEMIFIKPNVKDIVEKVEYYLTNYTELLDIGERGRDKTLQLYSIDSQISRRISLLSEHII